MVSLTQTEKYHMLKAQVDALILRNAKNGIVYGAKAINIQMNKPSLRVPTQDYDIYVPKPKRRANIVEKKIDKLMGFDSSEVRQGLNKDTYKVKSLVTGDTLVDYTISPKKKVPSVNYGGVNYASLNYIKGQKIKTLKEGISSHRVMKDKDQLSRVKIAQKAKRISLW